MRVVSSLHDNLGFGKHKQRSYAWLIANDRNYLRWMLSECQFRWERQDTYDTLLAVSQLWSDDDDLMSDLEGSQHEIY